MSSSPEQIIDDLARMLTHALRELANAGQPTQANTLAGQAWAAVRHDNPQAARRINGAMHYIARLEGEGVGRSDGNDLPTLRITTLIPAPEQRQPLLRAARQNTKAALAAGALTAEVYDSSEGVKVVSRWEKESDVQEFLSWHETEAHDSLAPYLASPPASEHYLLAR